MALTPTQIRQALRQWVKTSYSDRTKVANLNTDDIRAAIESIDSGMDTIISTIPGAWETKSIKQALIDNLPEPFRSKATAEEKALVFSAWAMSEAGVI